jgi:carbamoyltransferase
MYLAEKSKKGSNSKNLCVTGGSFLNCNTNYNILTSGLYENVHLFPALDDSGISVGAALYGALKYDKIIHKDFFNPYLGRTYSDSEILKAANKEAAVFVTKYESEKKLIEKTVELLSNDKVIGWFQGGSEIGPRALGNRSILASPMSDGMRAHINSNVKLREWYRPFAPAVLYEKQKEIFDFDYFSPYMLVTAEVKEEWRSRIPSVTHHDNTARYQSVTPETNSKFYNLIKEFDKKTGVPVLLNTSFNGPTEPIVETPEDAIRSFLELEIDYLVIGNFLIQKRFQKRFQKR